MNFLGRGHHDTAGIEAAAHSKHEEMQRRSARGERNIRHGATSHKHPLWERALGWLLIGAAVVVFGWFAIFGYKAITGGGETAEDGPGVIEQSP